MAITSKDTPVCEGRHQMLEIVPSSVGRVGARSGVVKRCRAFLRFASHTLLTVCDVAFVLFSASCFFLSTYLEIG